MGHDTSLKTTINTAFAGTASDRWSSINQNWGEAVNIYDCLGGDITISFKFRSNVTGTYPISLVIGNANWEVADYVATFDYNNAGTIQDIEVTIPLPDNNQLSYDVTNTPGAWGFGLAIGQIVGSDYEATAETWSYGNNWYASTSTCTNWATSAGNYIEIAQVQLEKGSSKTEFEKIDYGQQLAKVQRYYQKLDGSFRLMTYVSSGTSRRLSLIRQVEMRGKPTNHVTYVSGGGGTFTDYSDSSCYNFHATGVGVDKEAYVNQISSNARF